MHENQLLNMDIELAKSAIHNFVISLANTQVFSVSNYKWDRNIEFSMIKDGRSL